MLYILLGPDKLSKREYVYSKANNLKIGVDFFSDLEEFDFVQNLASDDLFGKSKIFVFEQVLEKFLGKVNIESIIKSKNQVFLFEEKLDKRKTENKALLANPAVSVMDFTLPHGLKLNDWIKDRIKSLNSSISLSALEELAVRIGRDKTKEVKVGGKIISQEEIYNLDQIDTEIRKLIAYSNKKEIQLDSVKELVSENLDEDVFVLTNAIADGQKQKAIELAGKFFESQTGIGDKANLIKLNALLSEQLRNVVIVQDFLQKKYSEDEILEKTGWKSGRLFIMKKVAERFKNAKVLETLNKFKSLDEELKTSQLPPRVLFDLILTQMFS